MKKILILNFVFAIAILTPSISHSYIIDGQIGDWGVILGSGSDIKGFLDTNLPSGGNDIDYFTEDNADKNSGRFYVGPGWTDDNRYDAEAIYMDNDANYLYLAIVTGTSPTESVYPAGDIFIDTGKYQDPFSTDFDPMKYALGINIEDGKLYEVSSYLDVKFGAHSSSGPWRMDGKTLVSENIEFAYGPKINDHYIIESKIPLDLLFGINATQEDRDVWLSWTMWCGNDALKLHGDVNAVPEPATMTLMATGLAGLMGTRRRKKKA